MDSNFVDLDILLTHIRESRSRRYFLEAVKAYKAGALRAAISSAWVAVVYDLILKYQELSNLGNPQATVFLNNWNNATAQQSTEKLVKMESGILNHAMTEIQLLNPNSLIHLERLRKDRHLCAHPAFDTQADLFEPSPELARLHLVNAIDLVLSQTPLQGKAILELFNIDVQSVGFPTDDLKIRDYVHQQYLKRTKPSYIINFGTVLAKSLLKGVPPQWDNHKNKVVQALIAIRDRVSDSWPELFSAIRLILNSLSPDDRLRSITFISVFPEFWPQLDPPTQTALQQTAENTNADKINPEDFMFLSRMQIPALKSPILHSFDALPKRKLKEFLSGGVLPELWPASLKRYKESDSFKESEDNFQDFVLPFAAIITTEMLDSLLLAIEEQNQNWQAYATPRILQGLLADISEPNFPTLEARTRFYIFLAKQHPTSGHQSWINIYGRVFETFELGGWRTPDPPDSSA